MHIRRNGMRYVSKKQPGKSLHKEQDYAISNHNWPFGYSHSKMFLRNHQGNHVLCRRNCEGENSILMGLGYADMQLCRTRNVFGWRNNKSCQRTTTLAGRQPSLNEQLRLKFFKSRSKFKVKVTMSIIMVQCERSCHKQYTCAIWKPYLFWQESYGQG